MNNPFEIKFTLKQHTPIIHFQHDQAGATLRATEVKPKLDRFIIQRMIEEKKNIPDNWYNNKEKGSLDYKLKVNQSINEKSSERLIFIPTRDKKFKVDRSKYPMILANMASQEKVEKLKDIRFFEKIECSVICLNRQLKSEIETNLESFFAVNNFGNRSNKGFGGFTISEINKQQKNWDEKLIPASTYFLEIPSGEIDKVFNVIDYFYKWLKSGINYSYDYNSQTQTGTCRKGRYKKAVLFEYLVSLYKPTTGVKLNWEKRWMKENFLSLGASNTPYTPKYYRALLGLSDKHTFTKANCYVDEEEVSQTQTELNGKIELQNNHNKSKIDRIKSPFTFKVVNISNILTKVYIIIDITHIEEIYLNSYDKSFIFFKDSERKVKYEINGIHYDLAFKFPIDNISKLDDHINRLKTHKSDQHLNQVFEDLEEFKNHFRSIDLPTVIINYEKLLKFFKDNYSSFRAKDFRWRDIINSEIKIKTT